MPLDEGTYFCLVLGITALTLVYHDLAVRAISRLPTRAVKPPSNEAISQACTIPAGRAVRENPATQVVPVPPAQEQTERVMAQLESHHRDEWCRKYEEEEVERYFRERLCQHEHNRQYDEDTTYWPIYRNGVFGR
jgi:hypothetical protein